ncbi:MAG: hypothetical protein U0491_01735 [Candidatus Saccharimonadales bacterium]
MKRKSPPKHKKDAWFVRVRGSYLPCSWQGALTYIPMVAFLVTIMMSSIHNAHSVSDALYTIFPYFVCTAVVMHWIASVKS